MPTPHRSSELRFARSDERLPRQQVAERVDLEDGVTRDGTGTLKRRSEMHDRVVLSVYRWLPDKPIKAVVQTALGSAEHAGRDVAAP